MKQPELLNKGSLITYQGRSGEETCLGYLFNFPGRGFFDPSLGKIDVTPEEAKAHNSLLDEALLKGLDENCEVGQRGAFYLVEHNSRPAIKTFSGTIVSTDLSINGRSVTFRRSGKAYRGRSSAQYDLFNFRRVA